MQTQPSNLNGRALTIALGLALAAGCQPLPPKTPEPAATSPAGAAAPAAPSPEELAEQEARGRAQEWLELVDLGQYAETWDAAAPIFQSSISKEQWTNALSGARDPLGPLSSRQLRATEYKTEIESAPEGKYVVVYYDSIFAQKPKALETVTLRQQPDDSWKVAGYFVQ